VSIIYDALKKTQKAREQERVSAPIKVKGRAIRQKASKMLLAIRQKLWKKKKSVMIVCFSSIIIMLLAYSWAHLPSLHRLAKESEFHSASLDAKLRSAWRVVVSNLPKRRQIIESQYRNKHVLDGVFLSENETVAMINKKMVRMGDKVDGMTVRSIDTDGVQMQHDDQIIFLQAQIS